MQFHIGFDFWRIPISQFRGLQSVSHLPAQPWCHVHVLTPGSETAHPEPWVLSDVDPKASCSGLSTCWKLPPRYNQNFCYQPGLQSLVVQPFPPEIWRAAASRIPVPEPMAPKKSAMIVSMPRSDQHPTEMSTLTETPALPGGTCLQRRIAQIYHQ